MKKIFAWLNREDINLKNKWWHRLFIIFFIVFFLLTIYNLSTSKSSDLKILDVPQWQKVNILNDRINSKVNTIGSLLKVGERIDDSDSSSYSLNTPETEFDKTILNDIYCSNSIQNYIEVIMENRNIEYLLLDYSNKRDYDVSFEVFSKYINENDIKCVVLDSNTTYDTNGKVTGKISFLRTDESLYGQTLHNNRTFYEISPIKTLFCNLANFIFILFLSVIILFVTIIIYYKVILYIIFGNKKII